MIKKKFEKHPFYGVMRMLEWLRQDKGIKVNKKRIERLYRELGLRAIIPKKNLSKSNESHEKYPYLLRDLQIDRVNQVWETDITYLPMRSGFIYLTAIIDVYSRYIVGWSVSNTMSADWCQAVMEKAVEKYGKPEIVNTDQGSQYTSAVFIDYLKTESIQISTDEKGRALDNIYIERFWRTVKYEDFYLKSYENGLELYHGMRDYFNFYNRERRHQSLNYSTPCEVFFEQKKKELKSVS